MFRGNIHNGFLFSKDYEYRCICRKTPGGSLVLKPCRYSWKKWGQSVLQFYIRTDFVFEVKVIENLAQEISRKLK